ncbi:hypothetical protein NONS58_31830 [Nitrosococcus oceani]|nr:hypothetical protein NONS58_31830 [Nitrosococcus oceani]
MSIICTDVIAFMAAHTLKADPDVGLDILYQVAKMDRAIGVREGAGNKNPTRHINLVGVENLIRYQIYSMLAS